MLTDLSRPFLARSAARCLTACALAAGVLAAAPAARAQPNAQDDISQMTLLPGWITERGTRMAGVRITLAPGWKTYWRAPQGIGIPPQFDWAGSQNVARAQVHFPAPEVLDSFGQLSLAYSDEVVFPVELTLQDPAKPVRLALSLSYGVCAEVCVPALSGAALAIPPEATGGGAAIRAAWNTRPVAAAAAGFTGAGCTIRPAGDGYALSARLAHRGTPATPRMVVFEPAADDIWITTDRASAAPGELRIDATIDYFGEGAFALDRGALRMTLIGDGRTVELTGCPAP
ncbi:hypothetical protein GE300_02895 [Rhodobacteraceae bacterium 2CG4]|uniref:Thiol:disulfide interchange protein DsbD N-terminal domain-containing protein n=1 Tax=Halovulum marinum TaxID=2662447 RepID=A0A6L5YW34_9RHOB|nr:protein-disulfide reductase DsbD domain-containing protein [Halovulum marinum]MSU88566.1 hypothetical protein [Halovulum marinum]